VPADDPDGSGDPDRFDDPDGPNGPDRFDEPDGPDGDTETDGAARVVVHHEDGTDEIAATPGEPLRDALLAAELSPYAALTETANCGGRGLCATCGVRLRSRHDADHWHDRLAARFGYPRLSCQILVEDGMEVELVADKRVWGGRE